MFAMCVLKKKRDPDKLELISMKQVLGVNITNNKHPKLIPPYRSLHFKTTSF